MKDYQQAFIRLALQHQVLKFGEFTLKSGRISPYFFNAGLFHSGQALSELGQHYAQAIADSGIDFDLLFGPAYKGIPLAAVTASALYQEHQRDCQYTYNRKEAKDHGEGGTLVGAPLKGQVLILDDVMTAGTAIREVMDILQQSDCQPAGVVIALDRQEKGQTDLSAVQQVIEQYGIPVCSIIRLRELIQYIEQDSELRPYLAPIQAYRDKYGI